MEASDYADLRAKLLPKLHRRKSQHHHPAPATMQSASPLRKGLSCTPAVDDSPCMQTDSGDLRTSLKLLGGDVQPGSGFFALALQNIVGHSLCQRITSPDRNFSSSWLEDIRDGLREAGASEERVELITSHVRTLALAHLSPILLDVVQTREEIDTLTVAVKQRLQSRRRSKSQPHSPSRRLRKEGHQNSPKRANTPQKQPELRTPPLPDQIAAVKSRVLHEFDAKFFAELNNAQRRALARRAFSIPMELYYYHVQGALPEHEFDDAQTNLIWSKLTEEQISCWSALLVRLYEGDLDAASVAGARLLEEQDILPRVKVPTSQPEPETEAARRDEGQAMHRIKYSHGRPVSRSVAAEFLYGQTKSPYFG